MSNPIRHRGWQGESKAIIPDDAVIVNISAKARYDLSTTFGRRDLFKCTALRSPENSNGEEMQFDSAKALRHADYLQYQAFTMTVVEK